MDSAIIGSTNLAGNDTTPYIVSPSVMECASVNVLTCVNTERQRALNRKMPMMKRMWSNPFGRICVNPSARYCSITSSAVAGGGGAINEISPLDWLPSIQNV